MALFSTFLLVILAIAAAAAAERKFSHRIIAGNIVDTFKRFPHHVTIDSIVAENSTHHCSGSIISNQWILSSMGCLSKGESFEVHFSKQSFNSTAGAFSVTVRGAAIQQYPTLYDDLALLKLPVKLQFTDELKPIALSARLPSHNFVVMPGFTNQKTDLSYGWFSLIPNEKCKSIYGSQFDEYLQICTKGWKNNNQVPCEGNEGGGLISGWPKHQRLVGVFSTPLQCESGKPAIYINVVKYISWISHITGISS